MIGINVPTLSPKSWWNKPLDMVLKEMDWEINMEDLYMIMFGVCLAVSFISNIYQIFTNIQPIW